MLEKLIFTMDIFVQIDGKQGKLKEVEVATGGKRIITAGLLTLHLVPMVRIAGCLLPRSRGFGKHAPLFQQRQEGR